MLFMVKTVVLMIKAETEGQGFFLEMVKNNLKIFCRINKSKMISSQ